MVDFGGWLSGAGSAVDKFLGGTGGEPIPASTPVITADEYAVSSVPVETQVQSSASVIPENYTVVTDSANKSGEYRPTSMDTSAPAAQLFVESYVQPTQEIDRIDYTKMADIGDSKTQELIKQGYSPEQATALQREEVVSDLMGKGYTREQAVESRAARYYQNEYDKSMQSKEALSSEYHHEAMESGLPQAINPFEHTGDLAKMALERSQGVSNISGTGLIPQFKGSLLEDANIVTKSARMGDLGDYKYLGKPYSSVYGTLSLEDQQAIGRAAATSKYNPYGWEVKENAMDRFTPELAKSSGFNLFYKPANLEEARKLKSPTGEKLLSPDYIGSIVQGNKLVGRTKEELKTVPGSVINIGGNPTNEIIGGTVVSTTKGTTVGKGIKSAEELNEFLLPEDMVHGKSDYKVELPGARSGGSYGVVSTSKLSGGSDIVNAPTSNFLNRVTEGRAGGDVSMGGLRLYSGPEGGGLLLPLRTPRGSAMDRGALYRKSKKSNPVVERKPKSKPFGMMTVEDHSILKTIGKDFFKFKVSYPTGVVKANRAYVNPIVPVKGNAIGFKKTMNTEIILPKINSPHGASRNMAIDVSRILTTATKKINKKSK